MFHEGSDYRINRLVPSYVDASRAAVCTNNDIMQTV